MIPVHRSSRLGGLLVAAVLFASVAAGCSSGGSASMTVTDPWARNAPKTAGAGAAYMTIQNTGAAADALIGASSPAAKTVQVHETYVIESPMPSASDAMGAPESPNPSASGTMGGEVMGMRPIARLEVPAGGTVELKPGGYHIMLMELTTELKAGDKVEITLKFEKAGDVKVTAEVRES
jgi:copper(I)-binding protein